MLRKLSSISGFFFPRSASSTVDDFGAEKVFLQSVLNSIPPVARVPRLRAKIDACTKSHELIAVRGDVFNEVARAMGEVRARELLNVSGERGRSQA